MIEKLKKPSLLYKRDADKFIKQYGGLTFQNCSYRQGAYFTTDFGYTAYSGPKFDKPGLHKGVDRGAGQIICPFDFPRSGFRDWGWKWWGSDVYLYHSLGFRFRISHMYPGEIYDLDFFRHGDNILSGEKIGLAGNYGQLINGKKMGRHTHTEIESWGYKGQWLETCQALDWILYIKYEDESLIPFSQNNIIRIAREKCKITDWSNIDIIQDYERLLREKSIIFINKYKMIIRCRNGKLTTLYNSRLLFNM